jgi:hypothetical protein
MQFGEYLQNLLEVVEMPTNFANNVVQNVLTNLKENEKWPDNYCNIFIDLNAEGKLSNPNDIVDAIKEIVVGVEHD